MKEAASGYAARRALGLPPHGPGLRIGLFGGSFDPPHAGHRAASLFAMRRLGLDWVWWLVSPGNPLKDTRALPPLPTRLAAVRKLAFHPRLRWSAIEAQIGARYSYQTIAYLKRRCPGVHFVWIMGADSLATFHKWRHWRQIAASVPIAVVDRPGSTYAALHSPAGTFLARYRLHGAGVNTFATSEPPAFIFLHWRRSVLSSTALRAHGVTG